MTRVTEDQFEWRGKALVHLPTGAKFALGSDFVNFGRAGEVLADGRDFDRDDVLSVAPRLVAKASKR